MPWLSLTSVLAKGWFSFIFDSREMVDRFLGLQWCMDGIPLFLKRCDPPFDAKMENLVLAPLWVRLPSLPMHLWASSCFAVIGNFLAIVFSFQTSGIMTVAWILVNIDLKLELLTDIQIKTSSRTFSQILDYEGVPF